MNLSKEAVEAAKSMDWEQIVQNGGPPCFFLEEGRFCGRAQRWFGHTDKDEFPEHRFVSFAELLTTLQAHAQALAEALTKVKRFVPLYHEDEDYHEKVHKALDETRAALDAARRDGAIK